MGERDGRFRACNLARDLVRGRFTDGSDQRTDEVSKSAQCLACYYVQLFFMFRSMRQEDVKVVALAAAFLACKVTDSQRRMRDLLRTNNQLRGNRGETELGEEEQRALRERIVKLEFMMLRIIRFNFDLPVRLSAEELERLSNRLLVGVAMSAAFKEQCKGQPAGEEANKLKPKLLQLTASFLLDAFMGFGPVLFAPRILAAGAFAFSVRYLRREMTFPELSKLMEEQDASLRQTEVMAAIQEIMNVFRAKTSVADGNGAGAAKATAIGSTCTTSATTAGNANQRVAIPGASAGNASLAPSAAATAATAVPAVPAAASTLNVPVTAAARKRPREPV